jgi:hypothetical protein
MEAFESSKIKKITYQKSKAESIKEWKVEAREFLKKTERERRGHKLKWMLWEKAIVMKMKKVKAHKEKEEIWKL